MITEAELERIERLVEAATEGPWSVNEKRSSSVILTVLGPGFTVCKTRPHWERPFSWNDARTNAAFIASSRTDVPALLSAVRELTTRAEAAEAEVERLRGALKPFATSKYAGEVKVPSNQFDAMFVCDGVTVGHFRAARAALGGQHD